MKLNDIQRPAGRQSSRRKRRGRGDASGQGSTSGRGHKGQRARAGGYHKVGFEGGQMPLQRRLPKRGFTNIFRRPPVTINVDQLTALPEGMSDVNIERLLELRWIKKCDALNVKLLGRGDVNRAFNVRLHAISESARKKIEAAGGKVEVIRV